MLDTEEFERIRPRLKRLAYRMLGSWSESEDAVQDAYLRLGAAPKARKLEALARTTVARLCLDRLKSARARRETYPGEWLPEPVLDNTLFPAQDPFSRLESRDSLAYGLLVIMERLKPEERVVFVLREALELSYREVSQVLGKAEASCRQLMVQARKHLHGARPTGELAAAALERFILALQGGDSLALCELLSENAVSISDGGGKAAAAIHPILGAKRGAAFMLGLARKAPPGLHWQMVESNGQACLLLFQDKVLISAFLPQLQAGLIDRLFIVRNPAKLAGLT
ncbi:sigma-70 family RNA polymerase sigma factor [bacterium]|nr:sigma-70 family RNA polymerase sigma factor [bacterium]